MSRLHPADDIARAAEYIAANDNNYHSDAFHRQLYDLLKNNVLPSVPPDASPQLPFIVYAIRNILKPSFLFQEIPNLLKLVVHLEIVRNVTLNAIRRFLDIAPDQHHSLEKLIKPSRLAAQRKVYRKIIDNGCLLHIHYLWRVYDPDSDPDLTDTLINYFPAFFLDRDPNAQEDTLAALQTCPWHHGITQEELGDNRDTGKTAVEFVVAAAKHAEDREAYCNDNGFDIDTPFDDIFPPPDAEGIAAAVMRFVKMVENAVVTLDEVLDAYERIS